MKTNDRQRVILHGLVVLAGLAAAMAFSLSMTVAPPPRSPATTADFSLDNALGHVRAIATEPHPADSLANARVRAYLIDQFSRLGLDPQLQTANVVRRNGDTQTVHNLLARLPGRTATGKPQAAIMLAAHYDSVPGGPGAADDTAAVAALLETVRALQVGSPLGRDVLLLITDGEEMGLLGARGFFEWTEGAEWTARIGLVMNFEARGTAGPSVMFETAPHNLSFIRQFAAAAPHPIANSLSYDVYRLLPNNTDFTVFRAAGLKGLNFAFSGNYFYYHTKNDSPANLDPGSLYHHGSAALALTRHFANLSNNELSALVSDDQPNAVYFNLTSTFLARYPATWIWPLTLLQWIVTALALTRALRRRAITLSGLVGAAIRLVLALLVTPAAVYGLILILRPPQTPASFNLQLLAIAALSMVITLAIALEFRRRVTPSDLAAAGLILFSVLSIPINLYLPGGSFVTLWPTLFATGGFAATGHFRPLTWPSTIVCMVAVLPAVLLLVPLDTLVFTALKLPEAPRLSILLVLTVWLVAGTILHAIKTPFIIPAKYAVKAVAEEHNYDPTELPHQSRQPTRK